MTRIFQYKSDLLTALAALAFSLVVPTCADAQGNSENHVKRVTLTCSGDGVFSPVNIGIAGQKGVGLVIGDGSGRAAYIAFGNDFKLDGVQYGPNGHTGTVQSRTTGEANEDGSKITWPVQSVRNPYAPNEKPIHVMPTALGVIYLRMYYQDARWELSPAEGAAGVMCGCPVFYAVGGTGIFHGANGRIECRTRTDLATEYNPANGGTAIFHYEFNGYLDLHTGNLSP